MSITAHEISNNDDIIDSRDVIARIEELEAGIARLAELQEQETLTDEERQELADVIESTEQEDGELAILRALAEEGANNADDWQYGETLIRDSYFVTYAEQLADDTGAIDRNVGWPARHIDWDAAAEELQNDYNEIDYDGVTYWIR